MTTLVEAVRAYPLKGEQNKIDVVGQQEGNTRRLEGILGTSSTVCDTSSRTNQKMVPGTLSTSHHSAHLNPPTLGGPNDAPLPSSTRQLASSIPLSAQNHHPFPSFLPLPPPVFSPMLTLLPENPLRRPNKLRKPSRISPTPPVLAPLSFIEEPELDVDFEHISHDVQHTSFCPPRQQSLTNKTFHQQDAPPPDLCERPIRPPSVTRRLTKRRRMSLSPIPQAQIVSSSSGAAAAAAATGNPAAPVAAISQISSPISTSTPHRAQSDVGHGLRSSLSVKRSNIIRRLSMRSPKHSLDAGSQSTSTGSRLSGSTGFTTLSSGSIGRWSRWRGTASDSGHNSTNDGPPVFLPLVRVTSPLSVTLVRRLILTPSPPLPLKIHPASLRNQTKRIGLQRFDYLPSGPTCPPPGPAVPQHLTPSIYQIQSLLILIIPAPGPNLHWKKMIRKPSCQTPILEQQPHLLASRITAKARLPHAHIQLIILIFFPLSRDMSPDICHQSGGGPLRWR